VSLHAQLNRSALIERPTPVRADDGEVTLTWAEVASGVPCALQPRAALTRQTAAGLRRETTHVAYLPAGTDLRPISEAGLGDRLTIEGVTYLAASVAEAAGRGRLLRAELVREV